MMRARSPAAATAAATSTRALAPRDAARLGEHEARGSPRRSRPGRGAAPPDRAPNAPREPSRRRRHRQMRVNPPPAPIPAEAARRTETGGCRYAAPSCTCAPAASPSGLSSPAIAERQVAGSASSRASSCWTLSPACASAVETGFVDGAEPGPLPGRRSVRRPRRAR